MKLAFRQRRRRLEDFDESLRHEVAAERMVQYLRLWPLAVESSHVSQYQACHEKGIEYD